MRDDHAELLRPIHRRLTTIEAAVFAIAVAVGMPYWLALLNATIGPLSPGDVGVIGGLTLAACVAFAVGVLFVRLRAAGRFVDRRRGFEPTMTPTMTPTPTPRDR